MRTFYIINMLTDLIEKLVKFTDEELSSGADFEVLVPHLNEDISTRDKMVHHICRAYARVRLQGEYEVNTNVNVSESIKCCHYAVIEEGVVDIEDLKPEMCWYWDTSTYKLYLSYLGRAISPVVFVDKNDSGRICNCKMIKGYDSPERIDKIKAYYRNEGMDSSAVLAVMFTRLITASSTYGKNIGYIVNESGSKVPALEMCSGDTYHPGDAFHELSCVKDMDIVKAASFFGIDINRLVANYPNIKDLIETVRTRSERILSFYDDKSDELKDIEDWINKVCDGILNITREVKR